MWQTTRNHTTFVGTAATEDHVRDENGLSFVSAPLRRFLRLLVLKLNSDPVTSIKICRRRKSDGRTDQKEEVVWVE